MNRPNLSLLALGLLFASTASVRCGGEEGVEFDAAGGTGGTSNDGGVRKDSGGNGGSTNTGVLSLAPTVASARKAIPSIAAASNDGEERVAHTGSAVTRPMASCSPRRTLSTRSGHPAAAHAERQAMSASAPGTSRMNGVVAIGTGPEQRPAHSYVYRVTSTSVPACRPVAASGTTM